MAKIKNIFLHTVLLGNAMYPSNNLMRGTSMYRGNQPVNGNAMYSGNQSLLAMPVTGAPPAASSASHPSSASHQNGVGVSHNPYYGHYMWYQNGAGGKANAGANHQNGLGQTGANHMYRSNQPVYTQPINGSGIGVDAGAPPAASSASQSMNGNGIYHGNQPVNQNGSGIGQTVASQTAYISDHQMNGRLDMDAGAVAPPAATRQAYFPRVWDPRVFNNTDKTALTLLELAEYCDGFRYWEGITVDYITFVPGMTDKEKKELEEKMIESTMDSIKKWDYVRINNFIRYLITEGKEKLFLNTLQRMNEEDQEKFLLETDRIEGFHIYLSTKILLKELQLSDKNSLYLVSVRARDNLIRINPAIIVDFIKARASYITELTTAYKLAIFDFLYQYDNEYLRNFISNMKIENINIILDDKREGIVALLNKIGYVCVENILQMLRSRKASLHSPYNQL